MWGALPKRGFRAARKGSPQMRSRIGCGFSFWVLPSLLSDADRAGSDRLRQAALDQP
jgi:hypothetical protein